MKTAVIVFPGSNCDRDMAVALESVTGKAPETLVAFSLGMTLFVLTLGLNIFALKIVRKYKEQYE